MSLTDLILSQFTDVFRIVLLIGLVLTALRTASVNGMVVPLLAGVVFVAVIIPTTLKPAGDQMFLHVGTGIGVNVVILAVLLGGRALYRRWRGT